MSFSITVPPSYGYVVLSCTLGSFITNTIMSGPVMKAREKYNVPYPNMYATPGYHKQADEFNRIQRGHQNMFENITVMMICVLVGGVAYPLFCTGSCVLYHVGNILYQKGYGDTSLDIKMARYKKGGLLKHVGFLMALGANVKLAGSMLGWWN